ncbi:MAG TPA: sulfite exporter TauE/SafE family protein [Candidatus Limnocylindria bacterium]|nr:sulfite exporter TauE/SafE family protein [Candidatus Limnocylindria bacterium]
MPIEVVTLVAGAVSSFLSGLLGIGGGLVLTPLLLYVPGIVGAPLLSVKLVTGLTIVQAISGSVLGSLRHRRYGNVSARLVRTMGPVSAASSLLGALVSKDVPDRVLLFVFAAFALVGAIALVLPVETQEGAVDELHVNVPLAVAIAATIGFFGGMVGIGAIAFIIAALVYVLRIPARVAIGSSLAIGFFAAVAAGVGKAATAQIDPVLGAVVFVAALAASPVGAALSQRTAPGTLMRILAVVVGLTSLRIFYQALTGA